MHRIAYIFQYECPIPCVVLRHMSICIYIYVSAMLCGNLKLFSLRIVEFPPLFVCVFNTIYQKANKNDRELQNHFTHSNCFVRTVNASARMASVLPNNLAQEVMTVKLFLREFIGWNLGRYTGCDN